MWRSGISLRSFGMSHLLIRDGTIRHPDVVTTLARRLSERTTAPLSQQPPGSSRRSAGFRWTSATLVTGGVAVTVWSIKEFHDHVGGTEGVWRSLSFYSYAIPKYVEYRYHLWQDSPDHVWDDLHQKTSQGALLKILELEGFYIKCGQMCACNIGGAFPPIWRDTMSILEDQCPAQDFSVVREIITAELGDMNNIFESMEEKPIGSASIGQVHRARLKDGTPVVVKVRYPHVERLLRGDVRTVKAFAQVAQPVHVPSLEEMEKQFQTEFDYRLEAEQLDTVRNNLIRAGLAGPGKLCQVPKPYKELCTRRVLVMEELHGDKIAKELKRDLEHYAERAGQSVEEFSQALQSKRDAYAAQHDGERLPGLGSQEFSLYIGLIDSQRRMQNTWSLLYNITVGLVPGTTRRPYQDKSALPLNHAKMIDDLVHIHGHEILVDGFFNGDPHPGNILLCRTEDGTPQLGLIDFGQVKRLTKAERHLFAQIIIALDDDDRDKIVELMKVAGFRSERMDPEVMYRYAKVGYDQDNRALTNGLHIQLFMEEPQKKDPIEQLPQSFIMVARASLMIRGLAAAVNQSRSMAKAWRPIAERVLREDI